VDMFWPMRMLSVVYAWMVNVTATTSSCFVISVIWQFTRNAMGFRIYRTARGFVGDVSTRRRVQSHAVFVPADAEPLNRLTTVTGHTLSVRCGYQKSGLQIVYFSSQLTASTELQQLVGSSRAASVNAVGLVPASSATRPAATLHSMSHVPNRLACT